MMRKLISIFEHTFLPALSKTVRGIGLTMLMLNLVLAVGRPVMAQGDSWSIPVMVSTNTRNSWWPDVAVNGWGQPYVVLNSGRATDQGSLDLLMYSTLADGGWLEPNDIVVTASGGYTVRPAIAVDSANMLHVTFRGGTVIYYTQSPAPEAWKATSWTPRSQISGAGTNSAYYSDIAVDAQGDIHVVWSEGVTAGTDERWLWFGTQKGVMLYDGKSWHTRRPEAELGNLKIYAVIEDQAGIQWFGTDQGVYSFDGVTWQRFTVQEGLADQKVNCIAQDPDGRLWFGTDRGVSHYKKGEDQADDQWGTYTVHDGIPDNVVRSIAIDRRGQVWAGTTNGLARYDGQTWTVFTPEDGLAGVEVLTLAIDSVDNVWVGTTEGASQFNGQRWRTYTTDNGLISNTITAIVVDHDEAIWVGTDRGVSQFRGQGWISHTANDGLADEEVTALTVDSEGTIWVGTERGVSQYNGQAWKEFQLPHELSSHKITAIAEDRRPNAMCPDCSDIFYRHSTDDGKTWSTPLNLSRSFAGSVKPQVRVGSGGDTYVTWEEGEDWYTHRGYPLTSMYVYSSDGGNTWTEPTAFSFSRGASQQITLGVGQEGKLVVVWRVPEEDLFYYQVSSDNGASWSKPEHIPGVIAKAWEPFSLDAYDAAEDSAGNVHLLVLGRLHSPNEDLGLIHLMWNGAEWSSPTCIYASSDPPEWPRIDVGAGNKVYAIWFTRDKEHIHISERGKYKIWASFYQADAPSKTPVPAQTPPPAVATGAPTQTTSLPTAAPTPVKPSDESGLPPGLYTESDEIGRLMVALLPTAAIVLITVALRFGRLGRRR
jgi:hypothetical protein